MNSGWKVIQFVFLTRSSKTLNSDPFKLLDDGGFLFSRRKWIDPEKGRRVYMAGWHGIKPNIFKISLIFDSPGEPRNIFLYHDNHHLSQRSTGNRALA